jgi:hypothetical protein
MATIPQIRTRLLEVFPEKQADVLAHVVIEAHDDLVNRADFHALPGVVSELAGTVAELAGTVSELAEAQKRTEFAVENLAKQVGGLSNALGGSLEDFACDLVPEILEKHWRLELASAQPEEIEGARGHHEIDLVIRGTIDARPVMVVCEMKAAVSPTEVARFMKVIERLRATHPDQDIRALFFGYKADRKAREAIVTAGAAMVFTRGVMIPAA